MNAAAQSVTMMESLVVLAGMTAFSDDCDRLLKRAPTPAADRISDSEAASPATDA